MAKSKVPREYESLTVELYLERQLDQRSMPEI
jgi:hypothetical protein